MPQPTTQSHFMKAKQFSRALAALTACLLVLLLCACHTHPARDAPLPALSEPAPYFNRLFHRMDGGWTGGDGTLSVGLPDGRTLWLFGDTFLGTVSPAGRRPPEAPFIRNSLVVQKGAALETLFQSSDGRPSAFFTPAAADQWYWPGHATVEGDQLKIFLHRFETTEPRLWAWRWVGTDLAVLSLPSLTLSRIDRAPSEDEVLYGVCILQTEAYTYIYGTADLRMPKQGHLARAPAGQVQKPWQYFTGAGWSAAPAEARPFLSGVSTQYAVIQAGSGYYLFTMDGRIPFSDEIVTYRADRPWGPWHGPVVIYKAPEATQSVAAYNPFVHTQFSVDSQVLVSYNLNHITDPGAVYRDAAIYRPRFIRVDMAAVARRFDAVRKGTNR